MNNKIKSTLDKLDYNALIDEMRLYPKTHPIHQEILTKIVANMQYLITSIYTKEYKNSNHDPDMIDDMIAEANKGLLGSIERFDTTRNVKLNTFAYIRISGSMYDYIRYIDVSPRIILARMRAYGTFVEKYSLENHGQMPSDNEISTALSCSLETIPIIRQDIKNRQIVKSMSKKNYNLGEEDQKIHYLINESPQEKELVSQHDNQLIDQIKGHLVRLNITERNILDCTIIFKLNLRETSLIVKNNRISQIQNEAIQKLSAS